MKAKRLVDRQFRYQQVVIVGIISFVAGVVMTLGVDVRGNIKRLTYNGGRVWDASEATAEDAALVRNAETLFEREEGRWLFRGIDIDPDPDRVSLVVLKTSKGKWTAQ